MLGYVGGSRQKYAGFVQDGIREGFTTPWEDLKAQMVLGDRNFVEKLKGMKIRGSAKEQPSYRMIQSIDAEALIKKAADYFRAGRGRDYQETRTVPPATCARDGALVMELGHVLNSL